MVDAGQVIVGTVTIAYDRSGSGPELVLLHGIGGTPWHYQFTGLTDAFTVIAWHAPGYGRSSDPDGEWTMAEYAESLAGFVEALGIPRAHFLGQSWGGVLVQEFCRAHAHCVRSLILSDTTLGGDAIRPDAMDRLAVRLRAAETMTAAEFARVRTPQLLAPNPSPEIAQEVEATLARMIHPAGFRNAAIALAHADTRDVLPRIAVPTLVLCGELDPITPPTVGTKLIHEIPHAQLTIIPGAGHLGSIEQPEHYNAAVRTFLLRQSL
jgi:pimeloyl-ACP methyl ester carboxylesterase